MSAKKPRVLIVGGGRVGRSFARALRRARYPMRLSAHGTPKPFDGELLLLTVPDRAIAETCDAWAPKLGTSTLVVHTSGALGLDVLHGAKTRGLHTGSLHPLLAVASRDTELRGTWAAVDGAPRDRALLRRLATDIGMRAFDVPPSDRVRYHLGAVMAANSQAPLLEAAVAQLRAAGLPNADARAALAHLARSAIAAWAERGGPEGLTGPVARGDAATVARHLGVLSKGTARELYLSLSRAALELAGKRKPRPEGLAALGRMLRR
ncbi:MAG: DUF2520 domain-containing protein [Deltaproteobacteria bacterium]|nr:DUF2520 domain-containing protein [Deltaproteobacteria bacterium]